MIDIRAMRPDDVPLALELCRHAGWNQTEADWRLLLALEPGGVFVAEIDGRPVGTASAVRHDDRLGWIGMVLVHPDARRRGIGSALMNRAIDALRRRGTDCIKLDATDQGRPVYLKLGFRDERPIVRYAGEIRTPEAPRDAPLAENPAEADWPAVAALDAEAFGADRMGLLTRLSAMHGAAVVREGGRLRAFALARPGHAAAQLGPSVAMDADAAWAVAAHLTAGLAGQRAVMDVLPENAAAVDLAEALGLSPSRRLTRMVLGETMRPGRVEQVFAAAGFEFG